MLTEEQRNIRKSIRKKYYKAHKDERSAYHKEWYKNNKERCINKHREYNETHKEEINTKRKEYCKEHKEERASYSKIYLENHRQELSNYRKDWYKKHQNQRIAYEKKRRIENPNYRKEHLKTPEGRLAHKRHKANRRELGFIPLNDWFIDSEGHHINKSQVIYIPSTLHKKYSHNHNKPKTMIEINKIAFQYLTESIKQL